MDEKKVKRIKKLFFLILAIAVFFIIYIFAFKVSRNYIATHKSSNPDEIANVSYEDKSSLDKEYASKKAMEQKKSPIVRIKESKAVFLSDDEVESVKITGESLNKFKEELEILVPIRDMNQDISPKCKGYSNNGVKFETDYDTFRMSTSNKKSAYKIPVGMKDSFENTLRRFIYTSLDFVTDGKNMGKIVVYHKDERKRVWPWAKDELVHKILYKREVGKIQPEKEFEKSKDNYTIKMEKSKTNITIDTMGKDFIKVTCGDNVAYYEVYDGLYTYLQNMFK